MSEPPQYPNGPEQNPPGWGQQPPGPPPPPGGGGPGWGAPPPRPEVRPTVAIGYGWRSVRDHFGAFLVLAVLTILATVVIQALSLIAGTSAQILAVDADGEVSFHFLGVVFNIISSTVMMLFAAALVKGAFDAVDGREVDVDSMFRGWSKIQVLIAGLIVSVLTNVGLVLCILPGIVLLFLTYFTPFFVVAHGLDAFDALRTSFRFTWANASDLLLLALLSFGVIVLGLIACLVGVLVAMPVVTVAAAYAFRILQGDQVVPRG